MELPQIIAILALIVAAVAITGLALVYRSLQQYRRNQHVIMGSRGSVDIVEHVAALDEKLTNMRVALEDLTLVAGDHDVRIDGSLSRVGIVRFDAYHDLGGRQSTAVAFLNAASDGVVITTVVSRDFARMYVKLIREGQGDIPMAPEELEAVNQARGAGQFTIRPRGGEGATEVGDVDDEDVDGLSEDVPMAMGLRATRHHDDRDVDRENRRRKRKGLPPVEGKVTRSAGGWDADETPVPPSGSLAEQFIQQRKRRMPPEEPVDDPTAEQGWPSLTDEDDGDLRGL